ncbi:MAG: CHASE4 domain-containing protein [Dehalococcoidia bacterium]
MSLRIRTALATVFSVIVIMAALLLAYRFIVLDAYAELEADHAREGLARAMSVLRAEERALDILLTDWAHWDDTYDFVDSRSEAFVASNLPPDILEQIKLNALIIRDARGENVVAIARDGEGLPVSVPGLTDRIPDDSPLLALGAEGRVTGILPTNIGPLVLSVRPILMSDGSGTPRGHALMARLLDPSYTERIAEMLSIGIDVYPPDDQAIPADVRATLGAGDKDTTVVTDGPDGDIAAFGCLAGLDGQPVLVLRIHNARTIEAQSGRTLRALLLTVGVTGAVLVAALVAVINVTVVGRLRRLLDEMDNITGRGSSEGLRTHVAGRDEIGDVASGVNAMLDRLEASAAERVRLEQAVTERERLADEAFRRLDEGLVIVDTEGICTVANPAALRLLGMRAEDVIGQPLASVLPVLRPADDVTRSAGDEYFEVGSRAVAVSRSADNAPGRLSVVALRDITDARAVERLKRDLVATVSHELRTPLTAIQATVSMLQEGDGGPMSEMQGRLVGLLDRNTDRLRVLVDDLLDIGALEGGRVTLNPIALDLADICETIVEDIRPTAEQQDVTVTTDLQPAEAWADSARIRQVIENLLQNAVKFTPAGGTVTVRTGVEDGRARIVVSDTGIGIAPAELERVFEKFYRTLDGARFAHGTGLGLSIARSIVALHGGRLTAASDGHSGTTMTVDLPLGEPGEQ